MTRSVYRRIVALRSRGGGNILAVGIVVNHNNVLRSVVKTELCVSVRNERTADKLKSPAVVVQIRVFYVLILVNRNIHNSAESKLSVVDQGKL